MTWFDRAFATAGQAIAEARHELIDRAWFNRNFAPPQPQRSAPEREVGGQGDRDIHGNERSIER